MKKFAVYLSVFTLVLALAAPAAFARDYRDRGHHDRGSDISITNQASITNESAAMSNTGLNRASRNNGTGKIETGHAYADTYQDTQANLTEVQGDEDVRVRNNAGVVNESLAMSNTGLNSATQNGSTHRGWDHHRFDAPRTSGGMGVVVTGDAETTTNTLTLVNSTVVHASGR